MEDRSVVRQHLTDGMEHGVRTESMFCPERCQGMVHVLLQNMPINIDVIITHLECFS